MMGKKIAVVLFNEKTLGVYNFLRFDRNFFLCIHIDNYIYGIFRQCTS